MFRSLVWICLSALPLVALAGCFDSGPSGQDDGTAIESTEVSLETDRTSLEGRWIVSANQFGQSTPLFLIEILTLPDGAAEKSAPTVEQLDVNAEILSSGSKLQSSKIDGESIELTFLVPMQDLSAPPVTLNFSGLFRSGIVQGTIQSSNGSTGTGRMLPTETTLLAVVSPKFEKDRDRVTELLKSTEANRLQLLKEFVDTHRESPMSLDLCDEILEQAGQQQLDVAFVREVVDTYLVIAETWGPKMTCEARLDIARSLAKGDYPPEIVIENAEIVDKMLTDADPRNWKKQLDLAKGQALLKFDDRQKQDQGLALLKNLHDANLFDKEVTTKLAAFMRSQNRPDEAIAYFSELVALPLTSRELSGMQRASQDGRDPHAARNELESMLKELWQTKHGNLDGLEAHLDHVFEKAVDASVANRVEPRNPDPRNRVIVCELFTSTSCMPCIAADVAVAQLARTFPPEDFVVLQYHQDIPAPDPLSNPDAANRLFYYRGNHTPTAFLNGFQFDRVGGPIEMVNNVVQTLRAPIDVLHKSQTLMQLKLSATRKGDALDISASADRLEPPSQYYRLRLVLAEDRVRLVAPNGMRIHEMVVRAMPGGSEGIDIKDGRLSLNTTISISDVRMKLDDYLKSREEQDITFAVKPLELKNLHLVAFVQDDLNKRIEQAAVIAVPEDGATASSPSASTAQQPAASSTESAGPSQPEANSVPAPKPTTDAPSEAQPAEPQKQ